MSKLAIHTGHTKGQYNRRVTSHRELLNVNVMAENNPSIVFIDLTKYPMVKRVTKNNPNVIIRQPNNIEIKALQSSPEYQPGVIIIEDTNIREVHSLSSKSSNVLLKKQAVRLQKIHPFLYSSEYVKLEINDNAILKSIISFVSSNNRKSSRKRAGTPLNINSGPRIPLKSLHETFKSTIDIAHDAVQEAYQVAQTMDFGIIRMDGNELIEEHSDGSKTILKTFPNRPIPQNKTLILK